MKLPIKSLAGVALSAACIYAVARNVDAAAVVQVIRRSDLVVLCCAVAVYLLSFLARSARWSVLLHGVPAATRLTPWRLLPLVMVGYAANNVLPARMGEVVRAVALGKRAGVRKTTTLATILMERLFDGLTLLAVLGGIALFVPLPRWVGNVAAFGGLVFGGVLVVLLFTVLLPRASAGAANAVERRLAPKAAVAFARMYSSFLAGIATLRSPRRVALVMLFSAAAWAIEAAYFYSVMRATGLPVGATAALVTLVMVSLGTIAPSAPGFIGTYQLCVVAGLGAFAIGREPALGCALLLHSAQYVTVTLLGGAVFLANPSLRASKADEPAADREEAARPALEPAGVS